MDETERGLRKAAGAAVRQAREDRDYLRGRTPEQVAELLDQAARSATVCASCFTPLAPGAPVMMTRDIAEPAERTRWGGWRPPRYRRLPICILCWLTDYFHHRCRLFRCHGCGRPMRAFSFSYSRNWLALNERVCCTDCGRKAANARARHRRRVEHEQETCEACGERFTQTRSDQRTCSNRCRQKLHRDRHAAT